MVSLEHLTIQLRSCHSAIYSSSGRVDRASTSGAVDSGQTNDSKLVFTASLLDAQLQRDSEENKLENLIIARWERH